VRRAWLVLAAAAICGVAGAADLSPSDCPQVYQIRGSVPVERALNIVVISDGFTEETIQDFRCGAGLTMEKLVALPPFNRYSDSINVYRIDLISSKDGVEFPAPCGTRPSCPHTSLKSAWLDKEGQCERFAERSGFEGSDRATLGKPLYAGRPVTSEVEVDVRACPPTAQECQLLWPEGDGMKIAWQAAACAPVFDVAIVLANDASWAGGGTNDMHPPLAVATLNGINTWSSRARLLSHELGHTLGLLDEYGSSTAYSGKTGQDVPAYHHERNLVHLEDSAMPRKAPWEHLCTPPTDPRITETMTFAGGKCFIVCACEEDCDLPDLPNQRDNPLVGMYEGGFYNKCAYYRASQTCTMLQPNEPLCPACTFYVEGLFHDLDINESHPAGPICNPDPCDGSAPACEGLTCPDGE
jgi:hypothetical protein